ncbi:DUF1127 domain-containing protein [Litoreibacter roseus]|uniref:DUF1127 domain-containing protein n=1 Tax=Litoreibacter roseus TaxID=2601869 RepID=A0A6N6JFF4_9RHOB|nr:DUF1127 domain-containing protein [Litoreibacter roseus]GFE64018.1 hypothetical protein KIN_10920 [Litoreibacter roseus]
MAFIIEKYSTGIFDGIGAFFRGLGRGLTMASAANARIAQMDRLNAKTDDELAKLGLRREDIVRHVFKDILYI